VELAAVVCLAGCAAQIKEKHAEDASKLPALWTQRQRWRLFAPGDRRWRNHPHD